MFTLNISVAFLISSGLLQVKITYKDIGLFENRVACESVIESETAQLKTRLERSVAAFDLTLHGKIKSEAECVSIQGAPTS